MTGALTYLTICSVRNSTAGRFQRLRQPRYLLVTIGVLLYFGMMVVNRAMSGGVSVAPAFERPARIAAGVLIAIVMAAAWVMPSLGALRFTLADVHFLFPAPLTRRQLLAYKMRRLLLGTAGVSVFLWLVVGPLRPVAAVIFFIKTWLIMSALALHEAGASLYRQSRKSSDVPAGRAHRTVLAAAAALIAVTAWVLSRFVFAAYPGEFLLLLPLLVAEIGRAHV